MRNALVIALICGTAATASAGRSAPPGLALHTKDQCKNICVMARATCEDQCKTKPLRKQASCKAKCPAKEADCKETCAASMKGQKTKKELQKEDRAHERGLDRPGQAPAPMPPMPPPSLEHSGVGG